MNEIIEKIKVGLQPQGRALATAASFELFLTHAKLDETQLDWALAVLSTPDSVEENIAIIKRRETCRDIHQLLTPTRTIEQKDLTTIVNGYSDWCVFLDIEKELVPIDQKGRYVSMLETAQRELDELKETFGV